MLRKALAWYTFNMTHRVCHPSVFASLNWWFDAHQVMTHTCKLTVYQQQPPLCQWDGERVSTSQAAVVCKHTGHVIVALTHDCFCCFNIRSVACAACTHDTKRMESASVWIRFSWHLSPWSHVNSHWGVRLKQMKLCCFHTSEVKNARMQAYQ